MQVSKDAAGRLPVSFFTGNTLMASVFSGDGDIISMAPAFARTLLGSEAGVHPAPPRHVRDVLGEEGARERVRYFREVIDTGKPMVLRCVIRGVQHITHLYPAVDETRPDQTLVGALHEVVEGVVDPAQFADFNYVEATWNDYGRIAELSPRESEVAVRIGLGMDAKEIAEALTRSLDTVTSHKRAVYAKLGCDSQLKAALIIRRCGLTQRDVPRIARQQQCSCGGRANTAATEG